METHTPLEESVQIELSYTELYKLQLILTMIYRAMKDSPQGAYAKYKISDYIFMFNKETGEDKALGKLLKKIDPSARVSE